MRESRPYGSVRGARDETRVPTATSARVHHAARRRGRVAARRSRTAERADSLGRPGGNVTGVSAMNVEVVAKRFG